MTSRAMTCLAGVTGLGVASAALAEDAPLKTACATSYDERIIEVVVPGEIGARCDVLYTYVTADQVKVPYHANNSLDFCTMRAQDIVADLASRGYQCSLVMDVSRVASTTETAPAPSAPAETVVAQAPAPSTPVAPLTAPTATTEQAASSAPPAQFTEQPQTERTAAVVSAAPSVPAAPTVPAAPVASAEPLTEVLQQPAQNHAAVRGPSDLTDKAEPNVQGTGSTRTVGRLVGATPVEPAPQPATPVTVASAQKQEPAAPARTTKAPARSEPIKVAKVETPTTPAKPTYKMRAPEEIIRATINAQVAAWNEGNLDAYMETYWKSENLKFVSGTSVTKGWASTLKRYRSRYGDDENLGELGFNKLDIEMVTDDVAIVTGRFELKGDSQDVDSGAFSLVMKRHGGAWRIVHDHTVGEATN